MLENLLDVIFCAIVIIIWLILQICKILAFIVTKWLQLVTTFYFQFDEIWEIREKILTFLLSPLVCLLGSFYLVCFYAYEILFSKVVSKMAQKVSLGQFLQNQEKGEIYEIKFRLVQEKNYDVKDAEMPKLSVSQVKDTKDWQNQEKLTPKNFVESQKCNKFHRRFRKTKRNVRI